MSIHSSEASEASDTGSDLRPRTWRCRKIAEPGSEREVATADPTQVPDLYVSQNIAHSALVPHAVVFVVVEDPRSGVLPAYHYWRVECMSAYPLVLASTRTNYAAAYEEMRVRNVKRIRT